MDQGSLVWMDGSGFNWTTVTYIRVYKWDDVHSDYKSYWYIYELRIHYGSENDLRSCETTLKQLERKPRRRGGGRKRKKKKKKKKKKILDCPLGLILYKALIKRLADSAVITANFVICQKGQLKACRLSFVKLTQQSENVDWTFFNSRRN